MNTPMKTLLAAGIGGALVAIGAAGGLWWAGRPVQPAAEAAHAAAAAPSAGERRVLYWYDPMVPTQKFDKPGKSPFMDMELVPRYADGETGADANVVKIDPAVVQNLGVRVAAVKKAPVKTRVDATGLVGFNERDVTVVQARATGYVESVAPLAPGDVIRAGAVLAELLVPEWAGVQQEFLSLRVAGDAGLVAAARERMRLAGMPEAMVREVESTGRPQARVTIAAPRGGVVQELGVRAGMTLMAGQTVAQINGIDRVWLEVAVPEALAAGVRVGQPAQARLAALPGQTLDGRVTALLPSLNEAARTLRVRVELPNPGLRLRPGLSAQVTLEGGASEPALRVPSEAVIRTGRRALVIVAEDGGRFRPVEVATGAEVDGDTVVTRGLSEGQNVVASGQFLIDSEASLRGIIARAASQPAAAPAALHEADARIEEISPTQALIEHNDFPTLGMRGMTMAFRLARPELAQGLKPGDKVRVGLRQTDTGLVIESLKKQGGAS
jgi:Cu(I)/Ag(I) efflux system membrane fusion protein